MRSKPFLTQFAIKRVDPVELKKIRITYNEDLDYNEILTEESGNEFAFLSLDTGTRVKPEQPDVFSNNNKIPISSLRYLKMSTDSAVRPENPDVASKNYYMKLLSTKTITAVKLESADED